MEAVTAAVKIKNFPKEAIILVLFIYLFLYNFRLCGEYSQATQGELAFFSGVGSEGQEAVARSSYFTIYASPEVNLSRVYNRLNRRSFEINYGCNPDSLASPQEKLAARMDILMERVKQILDIYPQISNINVRIFKTHGDLNDEYQRIFGVRGDYEAFYINKLRTIYISEEDISDSIMAHEIGHIVVDHYFNAVPSEKLREMIAAYVDLHLDE